MPATDSSLPLVSVETVDLGFSMEAKSLPQLERPLSAGVREAHLLTDPPWVRSLGKLTMDVSTQAWKFPTPPDQHPVLLKPRLYRPEPEPPPSAQPKAARTRLKPPADRVQF